MTLSLVPAAPGPWQILIVSSRHVQIARYCGTSKESLADFVTTSESLTDAVENRNVAYGYFLTVAYANPDSVRMEQVRLATAQLVYSALRKFAALNPVEVIIKRKKVLP